MSHKGYGLEHETEIYFLELSGQTNKDPIISPKTGSINRTFRVPASGALAALKGDVRTAISWLKRQIIVECKDKRKKNSVGGQYYRLRMDIVQKNIDEATDANNIPVFLFAFKGSMTNRKQVVMRHQDLCELLTNLDEGTIHPDIESIKSKDCLMKMNSLSYTIYKSDIDKDAEKFLNFTHGDVPFVLFSWKIFDTIMRNIRLCNTPMSEQKKI